MRAVLIVFIAVALLLAVSGSRTVATAEPQTTPTTPQPLPTQPLPAKDCVKEEVAKVIVEGNPLALLPIPTTAPVYQTRYTSQFDPLFQNWTKKYWGLQYDWRIFKAQSIQESALRPSVKSHAGAQGLMQIMPKTFDEIRSWDSSIGVDVLDPSTNTAAGILYMRRQFNYFKWMENENDRLRLAFGAYNGGAGNINWARTRCETYTPNTGCDSWDDLATAVIKHPPTRWIYRETLPYVSRISVLMGQEPHPVP